MLFELIGLFIAVVVFSGIIAYAIGIDNDGEMYDWRTEKMVLVPTRYDVMLNIIIKS